MSYGKNLWLCLKFQTPSNNQTRQDDGQAWTHVSQQVTTFRSREKYLWLYPDFFNPNHNETCRDGGPTCPNFILPVFLASPLLVYVTNNYVFIYNSICPLAKALGRIVDQDTLVLAGKWWWNYYYGVIRIRAQGFSADPSW